MASNTKQLLTDSSGKPIPQMYDQVNDTYIPLIKMEYYGKSTDTKPSPPNTPKGATFLEIDTKNVYMNDGSSWVVF
jgi:hypothetical protein